MMDAACRRAGLTNPPSQSKQRAKPQSRTYVHTLIRVGGGRRWPGPRQARKSNSPILHAYSDIAQLLAVKSNSNTESNFNHEHHQLSSTLSLFLSTCSIRSPGPIRGQRIQLLICHIKVKILLSCITPSQLDGGKCAIKPDDSVLRENTSFS